MERCSHECPIPQNLNTSYFVPPKDGQVNTDMRNRESHPVRNLVAGATSVQGDKRNWRNTKELALCMT
jgi:hypothetical protein